MKIGVFGDSFAQKVNLVNFFLSEKSKSYPIWWHLLKTKHNHQVECFGEGGSSILYSAQKIEHLAKNYDLVIWALTTPGRFSIAQNTQMYHICSVNNAVTSTDPYVQKQINICQDYLGYIFDWEQENLIGKSIVYYLQETHKNIMVLPCFPPPLSSHFNLYNLCEWETKFYFPDHSIPEIYKKYQDMRFGHLTKTTHLTLARLINDNLTPGIFQTDYNNFYPPTEKIGACFQKF